MLFSVPAAVTEPLGEVAARTLHLDRRPRQNIAAMRRGTK
jgi:hypothetical protein